MHKAVWIGAGLVAWLATEALALSMTGFGHGTYPPLLFSLFLIYFYPAAFMHRYVPGQHKGHRRRLVLAAALLLNMILLVCILMEGDNFLRVWRAEPATTTGWILLWLGWQGLFILDQVAKRQRGGAR